MDYNKIARQYIAQLGEYDTIRYIGILNGYHIYNYTHSSMLGKKPGYPTLSK